jgi:hypothetical protein
MPSQIGDILSGFKFTASGQTARIWPVWKDSIQTEIAWKPIPTKTRNDLWYKARKWDQKTRSAGKHGGVIGRSALAVLHSLLFDFLNTKTGRLDPTIATIARAASMCERSVVTALQRLRNLRILNWQRRCEKSHDADGKFMLRQRSNAYAARTWKDWLGWRDDSPPLPDAIALGLEPRRPDPLDLAVAGIKAGDRIALRQALTLDPDDPLARALAGLGKAMGAI